MPDWKISFFCFFFSKWEAQFPFLILSPGIYFYYSIFGLFRFYIPYVFYDENVNEICGDDVSFWSVFYALIYTESKSQILKN